MPGSPGRPGTPGMKGEKGECTVMGGGSGDEPTVVAIKVRICILFRNLKKNVCFEF